MADASIRDDDLKRRLHAACAKAGVPLPVAGSPPEPANASAVWAVACADVLTPDTPFEAHRALFNFVYARRAPQGMPPAVWLPNARRIEGARAAALIRTLRRHPGWRADEPAVPSAVDGGDRLPIEARQLQREYGGALRRFSLEHPHAFWMAAFAEMGLRFRVPPRSGRAYDPPPGPLASRRAGHEQWLPGASFNLADTCFGDPASLHRPAVVWAREGRSDGAIGRWSYGELMARASAIGAALSRLGLGPGARVGVCLPMTAESVALFVACVMRGCALVGIADSFAAEEIAARLGLGECDVAFTQDCVLRGAKALPLYERVAKAATLLAHEGKGKGGGRGCRVVCLAADALAGQAYHRVRCALRPEDLAWGDFLSSSSSSSSSSMDGGAWAAQGREALSAVLFSSGTTGKPKAIPWDMAAPLKCGTDAMLHMDVGPSDVLCWPTNLGWMMGPWLLWAAFLNGAAVAVFEGSPLGRPFCRFVQDAKVTVLGSVPSLVKQWRRSKAPSGCDWGAVKCFSSSGEASNQNDSHWLSARVKGYAPIVEYIGGTELAGGYMAGAMMQPQAPSHFSTLAFGCDLRLLNPNTLTQVCGPDTHARVGEGVGVGKEAAGEVALVPPLLGASQRLLNVDRDHDAVYYEGMPTCNQTGRRMRRHGDVLEVACGGFFRAKGRSDDAMNLGGIKTSSLEIEAACQGAVRAIAEGGEVAAVASPPPEGGPDRLWLFAALPAGDAMRAGGADALKALLQSAISKGLNPLFKVHGVVVVDALPRTASNKIMRKQLKESIQTKQYRAKM